MSIPAVRVGSAFAADLLGAPSAAAVEVGIREVPSNAMAVESSAAGVVETAIGDGTSNYTAALLAPSVASQLGVGGPRYVVVWLVDGQAQETEDVWVVEGPLVPEGAPAWAPTVEDVAGVTPAYTRGGFDDNGELAGAEQEATNVPTYTADTSPTREHVEELILAACEEVAGRVGVVMPLPQYGLARTTAKWHVAAMIASTKQPAGTDDASGEYRANIANFRNSLDELVKLARMGPTRLS